MRTSLLALALCLAYVHAAAAQTAPVPAAPAAQPALAGLETYIAETLKAWKVPGVAVSIVKDGKVVLAKGYGVRDPATGEPMTEDSIFPIASMSKAFTSFSAGVLVDEGKMSFDTPVVTYLPGLSFRDPALTQGLTLRDMLSHRSGLPRHDGVWYHNAALTREQLVGRMPHLEATAPLRARFQYNNNMFVLSGLAVEKVAGQTWEAFTEERVFRRLGMTRTMFGRDRAAADPDHIGGTEVLNGRIVNVPLFVNTPILNPAGGVYSTAEDLANWMLVHLSGGKFKGRQVIQPATLADMHRTTMASPQTVRDPEMVPTGYGLGWFTDIYRGRRMVSHGGNLPGISTLVAMIPEERLGVTVLVNQGGSELRDALTKQILDRFLGASSKDWVGEALARKKGSESAEVAARKAKGGTRVAGTRPSHALADYAGTYVHPGYGPLTVRFDGKTLVGTYNDDSSPLAHWHYDVFDGTTQDPENLWLDSRMQFQSDMAGRIAAVQITMEPALAPVVFNKRPEAKLFDPGYLAGLTGTYDYTGTKVTMALSGGKLMMTFAGGTPAELIPALGGEFAHARRLDARIAFTTDASGRATGFTFTDASGVYEGKRAD